MKKAKDASCDEHRDFLQKGSDVPAEFLSRAGQKKELKKMEVFIKYDNLREACVSAIKGLETYKNITADDMVSPRHLCVQGDMSCKGESGGSLFVNPNKRRFFQVGVLSFGTYNPCETPNRKTSFPNYARDFYVDLLQVLPWLHKHLKDDLTFQAGIRNYEEVGVPGLWKTTCQVPVPKTTVPTSLHDYRPVALTSPAMKSLERLILAYLCPRVRAYTDPLQLAYQ
ncbi:unnamed protein product [Ranitomeya imitator]|uniref:Peptidase S1 domain-containing protein n=1 Tax=Ranitomeya imitator TaxID=111125 RepID=A0ABN9LUW7_9NEOB|nr:unnamed protein product [Ranitomeya imitator]